MAKAFWTREAVARLTRLCYIIKMLTAYKGNTVFRCKPFLFVMLLWLVFGLIQDFCGKAFAESSQLKKVRLQLQYLHQFQFAGFYVAAARGLYRQAGLDVEIAELRPGGSVTGEVLSGQAEFGVSDTELLQKRLKGDPLVALGVIFQNSAYCLVTLSSSQILSPSDLKGKRVGIPKGRGGALFRATFQSAGVSLQNMQISEPGWGMGPLLSGELDAKVGYSTDSAWELREAGKPFHIIYPLDYGIDFYGDTLFTRADILEADPEMVEKFRRASFEGWRLAFEDVESAIDLILPLDSVQRRGITRERLRHEASIMRHLILPNLVELGAMKEDRWLRMARLLHASELDLDLQHFPGFVYQHPEEQRKRWNFYVQGSALFLCFLLGFSGLWIYQLRRSVKLRTEQLQESERLALLRSEEARAASQAKSMFLAGVSHEFRTPLTAITGFADLLAKSPLSEQQKSWLHILRMRAQDLLGLVNQLLDLIETDVGARKVERSSVDLRKELEVLVSTFSLSESLGGARVTLEVSPDVPEVVWVPVQVIRQVLLNLLQNAMKYGKTEGQIRVICRREGRDAGIASLVIEVRDQGPGISTELRSRLFEPFSRGGGFGQGKVGSGLGLSICRKLLTAWGGDIWFENLTPVGCAFIFRLPLPESQEGVGELVRPQRILLVDDDPVNRDLVRTLFHLHGLTIQEAGDGQTALAMVRTQSFDFILMDLGLPDIGGLALTRQIRADAQSPNQHTPIIALTAAVTQDTRKQCEAFGMMAFMEKPIDFPQLLGLFKK